MERDCAADNEMERTLEIVSLSGDSRAPKKLFRRTISLMRFAPKLLLSDLKAVSFKESFHHLALSNCDIAMTSTSHHPQQSGASSGANQPQIVVRAGKHYVCSSCGVLVEIPADVVGQLVLVVDHTSQEEPVDPTPSESATFAPLAEDSSPDPLEGPAVASSQAAPANDKLAVETPRQASSQTTRAARPGRPKQPQRNAFAGTMIDGLKVPTAAELDRALNWVSFHLKVLDRQGSEIKRLRKLLKKQNVPSPSVQGDAHEVDKRPSVDASPKASKDHAHLGMNMANDDDHPVNDSPSTVAKMKERGPP